MPVPWTTILTHGPTIVDAARKLYALARKQAAEAEPGDARDGEALHRTVARLQEREAQQAALVADLARQVQELATAAEALRARLRLALVGAGAAVALAIVAVALALAR